MFAFGHHVGSFDNLAQKCPLSHKRLRRLCTRFLSCLDLRSMRIIFVSFGLSEYDHLETNVCPLLVRDYSRKLPLGLICQNQASTNLNAWGDMISNVLTYLVKTRMSYQVHSPTDQQQQPEMLSKNCR